MAKPGNDPLRSTSSSSTTESTVACAQCGHQVQQPSRFCPECGARVPLLKTGEVFEDKYEVVRVISQGPTTELYQVRHLELGEPRSIKILRPELFLEENHRLRFRREAKLASRVRHSSVSELYDFVAMKDGGYYMVSEYLDGRSLREWQEDDPDAIAVVDVGVQVLNGLGAIHAAGIVHRDISPETILVVDAPGATREGAAFRAKIADLGIAKGLDPISDDAATEAGRFMGNVQYSSPEQAGMSDELLDGRSDLYSLGVTLYELLSGDLPFRALTPQGYLERHVSTAPRSLRDAAPDRDFPASLDAAISKAIEKEREKRFQTAAEFRDALLEARKDLGDVRPKAKAEAKSESAGAAPTRASAPVPVPAAVAPKPVHRSEPEPGPEVVVSETVAVAPSSVESGVPENIETEGSSAEVTGREVTLPGDVQLPRDPSPQNQPEGDGFATATLASQSATRDVSADNTYDPLARKKFKWGTWLPVALLAALVLWGIWIMTRPVPESETGTLAITGTSSGVETETVAEGTTTETSPLAPLPPNIANPVGDDSILQEIPDPAAAADLTAQPAQVPETRPESTPVTDTRFPNPQVSEREAINIIITGVNRTDYYGIEARCVGVGSSRYVNGGYTIELIARSCPGGKAPGTLLGRWRVDGRTGDPYVQNSSGRYVSP